MHLHEVCVLDRVTVAGVVVVSFLHIPLLTVLAGAVKANLSVNP